MAHLSGRSGAVSYSASELLGIRSWSLDYTFDTVDTTDFADDGVRTFLPGTSSWSGTFEAVKDTKADQESFLGSMCQIVLGESTSASQEWSGSAIITGVHPTVAFDGAVMYTYDFQGSGALTPAVA